MSKEKKVKILTFLYYSFVFAVVYGIQHFVDSWLAGTGILIASTITFGNTSNPSNISQYMDSIFGLSLPEYRRELADNIGAANAFLNAMMKSDQYESCDGGTYILEPLMTSLAVMETYDGYDPLPTNTVDGITDAVYEWRQAASPISYNMKEVIQNKHRIVEIVKTRIKQATLGIQEGWAQMFMWGSLANGSGTTITTPRISAVNGSTGIDPIGKFIRRQPASATNPTVGNIDQSLAANAFWRNKTKDAAATTLSDFMNEFNNIFNQCTLGTGGKPKVVLLDQVSYELFCAAYFFKYKADLKDVVEDGFPFEAKYFKTAKIVMDDKVPDVFNDVIPTLSGGSGDPASLTNGSAFFTNTDFFKVRYQPERDFELLEDESGKKFAKPLNGDSRLGHLGWMGNTTMSNRRKQGVYCKIPRTLTAS